MNGKQRILIVDDMVANIKILNDLLCEDYHISVATAGANALALTHIEMPDLILLDIMMPEMDGYEVCRKLQADEKTADIPVVFVTAKSEIEDERKGLEYGAVDYITKPLSPPIVKARVKNHLRLKRQRDELRQSISIIRHDAEILQQKAELGIHAGGLAHDIANIINPLMLVQFIPDAIPDTLPAKRGIQDDVDTVMESIELCVQVCKGFTSYLQDIDEGARVQPVPPLLQPLDIYARRFKGKLEQSIGDDIPPILCKGYQLKRIFVNLFVNAKQALEGQKEAQISVRLWSEDGRVLFSIKDNGPGINKDILPHIFEELYTTKEAGTGLGLFLVKQIIDAHNGRIEVRSEEGSGTECIVSLPAAGV